MTEREYRQQLEQQKMQQRKRRKRKKRRHGLLIFLFLAVCASVVAGLFYAPFFNIGQVYCMGNVTLTEQEILTAAAVPMGHQCRGTQTAGGIHPLCGTVQRPAGVPEQNQDMGQGVPARGVYPGRGTVRGYQYGRTCAGTPAG